MYGVHSVWIIITYYFWGDLSESSIITTKHHIHKFSSEDFGYKDGVTWFLSLAWLWFISNLENSHFRLIREDFICSISFQGFRDLGVHDFSSQYMFPRENNMKGPNRPLLFLISNFRRQVYFIMQCWDKDDFLIGG